MKSRRDIEKIIDPVIRQTEFQLYELTLKIKDLKSAIRALNRTKDEFKLDLPIISAVDNRLILLEKDLYKALTQAEEIETRLEMLTR